MSLFRLSARAPAVASRQCTRCFSSSAAQRDSSGILDILGRSPAQRHPASQAGNRQTAPSQPGQLTEFARKMLPRQQTQQEVGKFAKSDDYSKHMYRRWQSGDVYAPHDLSAAEQKKWKTGRMTPQQDAFDVLGINPVNEYKNFTLMSEYMTEMGRIKHSKQTGLRPVNQRKIAKAIRRAIGLGLMPSVHRHPLVLKKSPASRFL